MKQSIVLLLSLSAWGQSTLQPGQRVQASLESGQTPAYLLELKKNQYIELVAEQTSVDVALRLLAPNGKQIQEVNYLGTGGTELLIYIAEDDGNYRLEVRPAQAGRSGLYALRLTAARAATSNDLEASKADGQLRTLAESKSPDAAETLERLAGKFAGFKMPQRQAVALTLAAFLQIDKKDYQHGDEDSKKALALWRELKDRAGEGRVLSLLGSSAYRQNQFPQAIDHCEKALAISRVLGNESMEAAALQVLVNVQTRTGQAAKAVTNAERVLAIRRAVKDGAGEASALVALGYAHFALTHHEIALGYYEQARPIAREVGDRSIESSVLTALGIVYRELSRYDQAIDAYEKALAISRELKDPQAEGKIIGNLGLLYTTVGQYEKAIACHQQSLASARASKDRFGEGVELGFIGYAYHFLGQNKTAIGYYEQALAIGRQLKILVGVGMVLNELGNAYSALGQYQKAVGYFDEALPIERRIKNRAVEGWVLNGLGNASLHLNQSKKAIDYYEQALAIAREVKDRATEGDTIDNLALAYLSLRQPDKAITYGEQALAIAREIKNRSNEHDALLELMRAFQSAGQPRLATFYGKQAVNVIQSMRSGIQGLAEESRRSFVESKKDTYRTLANLLISQGRLLEAQQVLNLLKEQEFFDYVRRSERAAGPSGRADLTAEESDWAERYRRVSEVLVAKGGEMEDLRSRIKKEPSLREAPDTVHLMSELQKDLEAGNQAFQQYLGELRQHFAAKPTPAAGAIDLKEAEGLKADLGDLKHGAVAIYTLMAPDRYVALLTTPRVRRAYESKIAPAELNRKILAFRDALENPQVDPLPIAEELYHILIPPALAKDLKQARAQTLMWSLDGALRYIPLAALYDGKHYLVEEYASEVFTPASTARLKDAPQANWRGVAFGVSEGHPGFSQLPDVATELKGIIREQPGDQGVLEGHRFLDAQFTRLSLDRELSTGYPVVHVASHFQFQPGDESRSFLLLGDGGHLTLADLKAADTIFAGVDLLTLSACSTGLGDLAASDGSEVEGFGALAQRKGAKAVIASLWPVADVSTSRLMRDFYRIRETSPEITKVQALRQAQLALLKGSSRTRDVSNANRGLVHEPTANDSRSQASPFVHDPKASFAHPYYWAPFFLMGNWL